MCDHYKILHLSPGAGPGEVGNALEFLRQKLGSYAPGILISDEMIRTSYPQEWHALIVLSDPESRAIYDASLQPFQLGQVIVEPVAKLSFTKTLMFYAAAFGLVIVVLLFLAFLGNSLV